MNALGQVFASLGLAFGSVVSFASYNRRSNKILVDTMAVTGINALTSLLVAVFAFATIGNIATEQHSNVTDVLVDGNAFFPVRRQQIVAVAVGFREIIVVGGRLRHPSSLVFKEMSKI